MLEIIRLKGGILIQMIQDMLTGNFGFLLSLSLLLNNSHEELELFFIGVLEKSVECGGSLRFIQDLEPCKNRMSFLCESR